MARRLPLVQHDSLSHRHRLEYLQVNQYLHSIRMNLHHQIYLLHPHHLSHLLWPLQRLSIMRLYFPNLTLLRLILALPSRGKCWEHHLRRRTAMLPLKKR